MDITEKIGKIGNLKGLFHSGEQILGLTSSPDGTIVAASYFEPAFHRWRVNNMQDVEEKGGNPTLEIAADIITPELSIKEAQGSEPVRLWPWDAPFKRNRAQVAQINDKDELLYLQNGDDRIGVLALGDTLEVREPLVQPGVRSDFRIEYFTQLSDGHIVTIENYDNCHMGVYRRNGNELEMIARESLKLFKTINDNLDTSENKGVQFMYGLAEVDNHLLMITDRRSNLKHGIYALDISEGIEMGFASKDADFKLIQSTSGMTGNGIAPIPTGLLISQYTFDRSIPNLGGPSEILYLPHQKK